MLPISACGDTAEDRARCLAASMDEHISKSERIDDI